jgi:hypothetical protein
VKHKAVFDLPPVGYPRRSAAAFQAVYDVPQGIPLCEKVGDFLVISFDMDSSPDSNYSGIGVQSSGFSGFRKSTRAITIVFGHLPH